MTIDMDEVTADSIQNLIIGFKPKPVKKSVGKKSTMKVDQQNRSKQSEG